jgi:ankyrin repeat protein
MYQDKPEDYFINMHAGIGTPLQYAAGKGSLDLVKFLVSKGADPWVKDRTGRIALDRALYAGHTDVIDFLRPLTESSSSST